MKQQSADPAVVEVKSKRNAETEKPKKLSALAAAALILAEEGRPMTTQQMIHAMAAKGYWSTPGGKTPHATLYSAILREISQKAKDARFAKAERGKFVIAG
ncbi:MAG TPA: HTH domain-containing protein [Pirellulales bacterium]|jgi:hypothetical protein